MNAFRKRAGSLSYERPSPGGRANIHNFSPVRLADSVANPSVSKWKRDVACFEDMIAHEVSCIGRGSWWPFVRYLRLSMTVKCVASSLLLCQNVSARKKLETYR